MLQNYNLIIADTSCFILLDNINELEFLKKISNNVCTTSIIAKEFNKPLPPWIAVIEVDETPYFKVLEKDIDKGEASALILCLNNKNSLLILDDLKARKLAELLHLDFTGTLGLILKAKQIGLISAIKPIIEKIRSTNFRLSDDLLNNLLKETNESYEP